MLCRKLTDLQEHVVLSVCSSDSQRNTVTNIRYSKQMLNFQSLTITKYKVFVWDMKSVFFLLPPPPHHRRLCERLNGTLCVCVCCSHMRLFSRAVLLILLFSVYEHHALKLATFLYLIFPLLFCHLFSACVKVLKLLGFFPPHSIACIHRVQIMMSGLAIVTVYSLFPQSLYCMYSRSA